jgi:hypothetical protein
VTEDNLAALGDTLFITRFPPPIVNVNGSLGRPWLATSESRGGRTRATQPTSTVLTCHKVAETSRPPWQPYRAVVVHLVARINDGRSV